MRKKDKRMAINGGFGRRETKNETCLRELISIVDEGYAVCALRRKLS